MCCSCEGVGSSRVSRESSQDPLLLEEDRLSTTSAMSESSVSHRLNDVQDVQDLARQQEESEYKSIFHTRSHRTSNPRVCADVEI